ncbi:MAG: WxL domain-containing protein [Vagococcus sp.]
MKKSIVSSLLISAVLLGGSATVLAEGLEKVTGSDSSYTSHSKVVLTPDTEKTDPKLPNEPDDGATGQAGPLSLDNVIQFDFGTTTVKAVEDIKDLASDTMQNVQVTDKRGTGAGWSLQVSQTDLKNGGKILTGATIMMGEGTVVNAVDAIIEGKPELTKLELTSTPNMMLNAKAEKGMGTWIAKFNETRETGKQIELKIPAGAHHIGEYKGTVIWTLNDTPGA